MYELPYPVYIVASEQIARRAYSDLLESVGAISACFTSVDAFALSVRRLQPGCIILDLETSTAGGRRSQTELLRNDMDWPVVVVAGPGDVALAVSVMKAGARDVLEKPVPPELLFQSLEDCQKQLVGKRDQLGAVSQASESLCALTRRELEVVDCILSGLRNKQVADLLAVSTRTVEFHRKNIFKKLGAHTISDVVRTATLAGRNPGVHALGEIQTA